MEKSKDIAKRKSRAIALGLADALRMVEQIHRQGGGSEVPKKSLESIIDSKETSSYFHRKLAALKSYGLIETHGEMVSLSPLGKAYATPISPEKKEQAALQAFRKIPLFENLINRYSGNPLPEIDQFFYNLLGSSYAVPHEEAPKWVKEFVDGARLVGMLVSEGGHEVVRLPGSVGAPSIHPKGGAPVMSTEQAALAESFDGELVDARILGGKLMVNLPDEISLAVLKKSIYAAKRFLAMLEDKEKQIREEEGASVH